MTDTEQEDDFKELIHHSDKRKPHGCLLLNMLLIAIPIITILLFVEVEMPSKPQESGEGNIYQKNSAFAYSTTRTISPTPLRLPNFADPAQMETFVPDLGIDRDAELDKVPAISPFHAKRGSAILIKEDLLALPEIMDESNTKKEGEKQDVTP